jgi:hypothetical protein
MEPSSRKEDEERENGEQIVERPKSMMSLVRAVTVEGGVDGYKVEVVEINEKLEVRM